MQKGKLVKLEDLLQVSFDEHQALMTGAIKSVDDTMEAQRTFTKNNTLVANVETTTKQLVEVLDIVNEFGAKVAEAHNGLMGVTCPDSSFYQTCAQHSILGLLQYMLDQLAETGNMVSRALTNKGYECGECASCMAKAEKEAATLTPDMVH